MHTPLRPLNRRQFLRASASTAGVFGLQALLPAYAQPLTHAMGRSPARELDLRIGETPFGIGARSGLATTVNGTLPGPLIRLREGDDVTLRVSNALAEDTSIHWHGLILPPDMDGVPGVSFAGIKPGETFQYRFPVRQSGTYWYHSHSGLQEQTGVFGPLVIDPADHEPILFDREYVVMLSDWTFENPYGILANLKKQAGYYNYQRRTLRDLAHDAKRTGWPAALADRREWAAMRMDPTDIADVTGEVLTYLVNGLPADANWTGLFTPGERVRLRFINAAAASYFDIRIPGLPLTVVQADGQNLKPVTVDELRIAIAETYDVVVQPPDERAYTIFAEAMDRSGFARGTLAPRAGMTAPIPERRRRPLRTMADMGMAHEGGGHAGHGSSAVPDAGAAPVNNAMPAMTAAPDHASHGTAAAPLPTGAAAMGSPPAPATGDGHTGHAAGARVAAQSANDFAHGPDTHGPGNSAAPQVARSRLHEAGVGLEDSGRRVLVYADLRSLHDQPDARAPERDVELHLTGNMDRYMWSFDGKTYAEARTPIPFRYGERLRLVLVNDTMMEHPIHLHGMWMELENGAAGDRPRKHTISVKPAERVTLLITADAPGQWAMHCHILYHMEVGMFRVVEVVTGHGAHS